MKSSKSFGETGFKENTGFSAEKRDNVGFSEKSNEKENFCSPEKNNLFREGDYSYREKVEELQNILNRVSFFFTVNEKNLEKLENVRFPLFFLLLNTTKFKELKALLQGKASISKENPAILEQEFDGYLADAYSETSKFLEKLESFKKKTVITPYKDPPL